MQMYSYDTTKRQHTIELANLSPLRLQGQNAICVRWQKLSLLPN
jgi:hypothetical protein